MRENLKELYQQLHAVDPCWSVDYSRCGENYICHLTVLGVTRCAVGYNSFVAMVDAVEMFDLSEPKKEDYDGDWGWIPNVELLVLYDELLELKTMVRQAGMTDAEKIVNSIWEALPATKPN
jgi:hypothetical protein